MQINLEELTIDQIHDYYKTGELSCKDLVQGYLNRIEAFDKKGPYLNGVINVNKNALEEADKVDQLISEKKFDQPLLGIPLLVKDQIETKDIITTFGSITCKDYLPDEDATLIKLLKDAGAIILAKTTMPDFATSWFGYCSMNGTTKNPYNLDRHTGGSSSGTAAGVAANFASAGIGEDTGGSIRVPACWSNLVGIKVTPGLISRSGMSALVSFQDTPGPMTRNVLDCAKILNVLTGYDPEDEYTFVSVINGKKDYVKNIEDVNFKNCKIGILRSSFGSDDDANCKPVNEVINSYLSELKNHGANFVDVDIEGVYDLIVESSMYTEHSKYDMNNFLKSRKNIPYDDISTIVTEKKYHECLDLLEVINKESPEDPYSVPEYYKKYKSRETFQKLIVNAMAKNDVDFLVYPTSKVIVPLIQEVDEGKWPTLTFPTNTYIGAQTWLPALSIPAGFADGNIPVGLEILGISYSEDKLLSVAYAFEKVANKRKPPESTPEIGE